MSDDSTADSEKPKIPELSRNQVARALRYCRKARWHVEQNPETSDADPRLRMVPADDLDGSAEDDDDDPPPRQEERRETLEEMIDRVHHYIWIMAGSDDDAPDDYDREVQLAASLVLSSAGIGPRWQAALSDLAPGDPENAIAWYRADAAVRDIFWLMKRWRHHLPLTPSARKVWNSGCEEFSLDSAVTFVGNFVRHKRRLVVDTLGLSEIQQATCLHMTGKDARDRLVAARKSADGYYNARVADRSLTPGDLAQRRDLWFALYLAKGSATDAAMVYTAMTGKTAKREHVQRCLGKFRTQGFTASPRSKC